ncbi:MAG: zinc ribbon domain-containing protein [Phycisphaerales bacterium]|nr:zinc ribbon domain-containing protein [Phycisphaerales bacterium]
MKKLTVMLESPLVDALMSRLEEQSIKATVTTGHNVAQLYGGGPRNATIWIENDDDLAKANDILRSLQQDTTHSACPRCGYDLCGHAGPTQCPECGTELTASIPDVTCPHCGEQVPGNFEICWSCGQAITGGNT